jgi:esterase
MSEMLQLMRDAATAAGVSPREFVLPTDHFASLSGLRFHYLDWGNPHLPPMLLLHGVRLQAHTWDMAALLLRDRYHIVALDQRGHGDSEWTRDEQLDIDTFDLMLEDLRQLIAHLKWQKFILVGMSMGGITALRYAAMFPDHLLALCIVDIAPETLHSGVLTMEGFKTETARLSRFDDFLEMSHKFMPHRPLPQLRYSLIHSLKKSSDETWTWKYDSRPGAVHRKTPLAELWNALPAIKAPALLMRGAQSKVLSPEVAARASRSLPRGELVTIDPATHNVHSDNPNAFSQALTAFLENLRV